MAVVVTALGKNKDKASTDPWTAFSSITLATGDTLFLCLSYDYGAIPQTIQWNSINKSASTLYSYNTGGVTVVIFHWPNVTGATGNVIIDWQTSYVPVAMAATLYKATGLTATPFDKSGTGANSGTEQSASTSANPTTAGDLAICVVGQELHVDDTPGTWESASNTVHENSQRDGTTGSGSSSNVTICTVASLVDSAAAVEHGHLTTGDSGDWACAIATFQQAAAAGPPGIKTINDLAIASVKTINDLAIGSVKTLQDAA